eukprot:231643_1
MASDCTARQQGFAGAYVLLGCVFTFSIIWESIKLIYRYRNQQSIIRPTPRYLLYFSMLFVFVSVLSLIKCIFYGLIQCNYITISANMSLIHTISQDLYVIQLYILWLVLMMRLYETFRETPFALTKLTIQMYTVVFVLLPFICFLWISPSTYDLFIVISYSLSIFITLSIVILFCYKLVQLNRYGDWHKSKQYSEYTSRHGVDLLSLITKHTILVVVATLFSFAMLLILITIFVFSVYDVSLQGQQQLLDVGLLLDAYCTTICVLFTFEYLHRKYEFCCSCLDAVCKHNCHKYFGINSLNLSLQELQLTKMIDDDKDLGLLDRPSSHHEAVHSTSIMNKNESIDDMLRRLHAQERLNAPLPSSPQERVAMNNIYRNISHGAVCELLVRRGFGSRFTSRGVVVYEKHYGKTQYDLAIVEEIIYRLAVKDKMKQLKAVQNLYQSREAVHEILSSLNFSTRYINLAMLLYEVMAEMFEIGKYHQNIYDLELITELIMRLRAKFTDYGDLREYEPPSPDSPDDRVHVEALQRGHIPQRTATTDTGQQMLNVVNHRMMSMSPDGFVDTNLVMKHAAQASTTVASLSPDDVSAAAPSSESEEEEEDDHAIEIDYATNMNDIRGEVAESEPMEVDATPRSPKNKSMRRPVAPKNYDVIIDFINEEAAQQESSDGEPITMMEDSEEEEEEKTGRSDVSFMERMKSMVVSPAEGDAIHESEVNYANMMVNAVRIEKEVLSSEKKYLCGLYVLYDEFIVPIFAQKLLHESYRKQVTSIIPQLIRFHEQFYASLRTGSIPRVFNKQSDFLRMYIEYVSQYKSILDIFGDKNSHNNRKLHNFLEHKRLTENKSLISYLILPIQRIPRYMLLLSELKKKTPKHHEFEYRDICQALSRVEIICDEINEKQREIENMSQCLLVSNKLKGLTLNIVQPQRHYIDHFIFENNHKNNVQFFIFNDIVIVADIKWRVTQIVELMNFEAKKTKNKEVKIRTQNKNETYAVSNSIPRKEQHQNIGDVVLFVKTVNKFRSRLYRNMNYNQQPGTWDDAQDDYDEQIFREEHETEEFAKWQLGASKGKRTKVEQMLKTRSEALLPYAE